MSKSWQDRESRILELLADEEIVGLDSDQQTELGSLLQELPEFDRDCMGRAAATVLLASFAPQAEPLPTSLAMKIQDDAHRLLNIETDMKTDRETFE